MPRPAPRVAPATRATRPVSGVRGDFFRVIVDRSTVQNRGSSATDQRIRYPQLDEGLRCDPGRSLAPAPGRNRCRASPCSRLTSRHRTQTASGIETIPQPHASSRRPETSAPISRHRKDDDPSEPAVRAHAFPGPVIAVSRCGPADPWRNDGPRGRNEDAPEHGLDESRKAMPYVVDRCHPSIRRAPLHNGGAGL